MMASEPVITYSILHPSCSVVYIRAVGIDQVQPTYSNLT